MSKVRIDALALILYKHLSVNMGSQAKSVQVTVLRLFTQMSTKDALETRESNELLLAVPKFL